VGIGCGGLLDAYGRDITGVALATIRGEARGLYDVPDCGEAASIVLIAIRGETLAHSCLLPAIARIRCAAAKTSSLTSCEFIASAVELLGGAAS
jgi:hypothetical protein